MVTGVLLMTRVMLLGDRLLTDEADELGEVLVMRRVGRMVPVLVVGGRAIVGGGGRYWRVLWG